MCYVSESARGQMASKLSEAEPLVPNVEVEALHIRLEEQAAEMDRLRRTAVR